jgi:serine kinase of HPr protein (carbohydrate metabolism regulator)
MLVADDRVCLRRDGARVLASPPETIRGKIEVRGVGIVDVKFAAEAELRLLVDLVRPEEVERMPEDAAAELLGAHMPLIRLAPWEPSAPIKLALALARAKLA